ncbi:MAG: DUF881 domain-containing protein, partial [Alicyclobacillus sp.]|nr:DUF881 domain-containing protein [Alicyclobacillus sp.]
MLTVQLTSRPQSSALPSSYVDLRTQVLEQLQENQLLAQQISKQRAQLVQYQAAQGKESDLLKALQEDEHNVAAEAGLTAVSGPGLTLSIQYDPSLPYYEKTAGLFDQIADQEIGMIVNLLFANGATAISINGQRLVTTSSIRLVVGLSGIGVLQVNTYPVSQPYVITAVGDVAHMQAVLTVNNIQTLLRLMQEACIIRVHPGPHGVRVPGYNGP